MELVLEEDLPNFNASAKLLIQRSIEQRLMVDPLGYGKPLKYSLRGCRRLRVSDYRVVYKVDVANRIVSIMSIKHRKDAYED